ncbi:MAG: histidine phosphatase family protein [Oscillospiraceae bacterium]|nr:histidine phosphatase family protein [Oscillospiraceae bacterium]
MHLYISRHGQSMGNIGEYSGPDPVLTPRGFAQARALGERLAAIKFDAVFASPTMRALATANEVAVRQSGGPTPVFWLTELAEVDRKGGSQRMSPPAELVKACPSARPYPEPGPLGLTDTVPPDEDGGIARGYAAANFLRERYTGEDTTILVVALGVFNSRFISAALGGEYPFFCRHLSSNAMLSCVSYQPDLDGVVRPLFRFHNDISHLVAAGVGDDRP